MKPTLNDDARLRTLFDMLRTRRPMGGPTETAFIARYIATLPDVTRDDWHNWHVQIPNRDGTPARVLWSCHTDTVHMTDGWQAITIGPSRVTLAPGSHSNCLGADDTAGVWTLREMILAGVPGHYVFHYGEERGGVGSGNVVWHAPELFNGIDFAIALDRRGTADVITHQAMGRCCSDRFARSLAKELRRGGVRGYRPCAHGVYTDTAEYVGLIGECTNLSIGYQSEHTPNESLDYRHALRVLTALSRLDVSRLTYARRPGEDDEDDVFAREWRQFRKTETQRVESDWLATLSPEDREFLQYLRDKY